MTAPAVILSHPQIGENIGAAARAMKNFGLSELRLIAPACRWPNDRALALASGAGDISGGAPRSIPMPPAALSDIRLVLATTARGRDVVREILTPEAAARRLRAAGGPGHHAPPSCSAASGRGWTMTNCRLADAVITIPTAEFSSLNLGQAVLLLGYEWLKSADATPASRTRKTIAVPATRAGTGGSVRASGTRTGCGGFFFPAAKKDAMVRNMRAMILRSRSDRPGSAHHSRHDRGAGEEQISRPEGQ